MIKSVTAIARNSKAIEAIKNDEYYFASTKQKKTEFMFYKEKKTTVAEASKNSLLFG